MKAVFILPVFILLAIALRLPTSSIARPEVNRNAKLQPQTVVKSAMIHGVKYVAYGRPYGDFFIKNDSGRVVFKHYFDPGVGEIDFSDFDGDGNKDIILKLLVADSDDWELVLFDASTQKFVFAGNCSNAIKIPHSPYFFTYADCCVGRDFTSSLCYISRSKIITVGRVEYDDGDGLCFYKINAGKKKLVKKLNVRIDGRTPVTTGPLIDFEPARYWKKNWRSFQTLN